MGPYKIWKTRTWDLRKTGKNQDLSETLKKHKKWDMVPQWGLMIGKTDPITLEKLDDCKFTFIYLLFPCTKGDRIQS